MDRLLTTGWDVLGCFGGLGNDEAQRGVCLEFT
jgi:hypothetical protein